MGLGKTVTAASILLAFFIAPAMAYAADLDSITDVVHGGPMIEDGDSLYRSDFSSITSFWTFHFSWPNSVLNSQAFFAVARGTFGNIDGGVPVDGVNYGATYQSWPAGVNTKVKGIGIPPLGGMEAQSGTYTVIIAQIAGAFHTAQTMDWFASGGASGEAPGNYAFLTFNYTAQDQVIDLPGALTQVQNTGRVILPGESVYRDEITPSAQNPENFWRFTFDWPNAVPNLQAVVMVFRGTFGDLDGGAAVENVNYGGNFQVWPAGHNVISKSLGLPSLKATTTDPSIYTVMVAERSPIYTAFDLQGTADWFASGGASGAAPRKVSTFTFDFKKYRECCSSVAFLPGIKGSVLAHGSDRLWPPDIVSSDIQKLALDPITGESFMVGITADGILHDFYGVDVYGTFGAFMDDVVTDGTVNEWQALPYDWRFSPDSVLEGGLMTASIKQLAEESDTGQVTIVAHSMGGLVGKMLIKKLEEEGKSGLIDSFVMVGTPQLGTPLALASLLHGQDEEILFGAVVDRAASRAVAQNFETAYNLLPSQEYLLRVTDPLATFDDTTSLTESWRVVWGDVLGNFTEYFQFLTGNVLGIPIRPHPFPADTQSPEVLRYDLLTNADAFHTEFDTYDFPDSIRVVEIAGWGMNTIKSVFYTEDDDVLDYEPIFTVEGDNTVAYPSVVSSDGAESYFINLSLLNRFNFINPGQHRNLTGIGPVDDILRSVISEEPIAETVYITVAKPIVTDDEKKLLVSVHSPVTLGAYDVDTDSHFTGIDPANDPIPGVSLISQGIPGSAYVPFGEGKYLLLPSGGSYTIVMQGTGNGSATVNVQEISNETVTNIASYSDIPVSETTEATLVIIPDSTAPNIEVDEDGDDIFELIIHPDSTAPPTFGELLAELDTLVQNLTADQKVKNSLLKRIDKLEQKIEKQKTKKSNTLQNLETQIGKKVVKNKIDSASADEIFILIDELQTQVWTFPLDPVLIAELRAKVESLTVTQSLKNSLLKKVECLEKLTGISTTLSNFIDAVSRKGVNGKLIPDDVLALADLLTQLENALSYLL